MAKEKVEYPTKLGEIVQQLSEITTTLKETIASGIGTTDDLPKDRNGCLDECKKGWDKCRKQAKDMYNKRLEQCGKLGNEERRMSCIEHADNWFNERSKQCTEDFKACMEWCEKRFPKE